MTVFVTVADLRATNISPADGSVVGLQSDEHAIDRLDLIVIADVRGQPEVLLEWATPIRTGIASKPVIVMYLMLVASYINPCDGDPRFEPEREQTRFSSVETEFPTVLERCYE